MENQIKNCEEASTVTYRITRSSKDMGGVNDMDQEKHKKAYSGAVRSYSSNVGHEKWSGRSSA